MAGPSNANNLGTSRPRRGAPKHGQRFFPPRKARFGESMADDWGMYKQDIGKVGNLVSAQDKAEQRHDSTTLPENAEE